MANSATARTAIPVKIDGSTTGEMIPYTVLIDTVDTDLTIHTPIAT